MSPEKETAAPANLVNTFPVFGRVEWVEQSGKSADGTAYYRTKIVSPSNDPYEHPPWYVINSEGQFAKAGQEINTKFRVRMNRRTAQVTDKRTGEMQNKVFFSADLWLAQ